MYAYSVDIPTKMCSYLYIIIDIYMYGMALMVLHSREYIVTE